MPEPDSTDVTLTGLGEVYFACLSAVVIISILVLRATRNHDGDMCDP